MGRHKHALRDLGCSIICLLIVMYWVAWEMGAIK